MGLFEHFPYTNFHELNLDWLLNKVKYLSNSVTSLADKVDREVPKIAQDAIDEYLGSPEFAQIVKNYVESSKFELNSLAVLGDSNAEGYGWWEGNRENKTYKNDGYCAVLREIYPNAVIDNYSYSGACFRNGAANSMVEQTTALLNSGKTYEHIIVQFGYNDIMSRNDVDSDPFGYCLSNKSRNLQRTDINTSLGAIGYNINLIKTTMPSAKIMFVFRENNYSDEHLQQVHDAFFHQLFIMCNVLGIPVVDLQADNISSLVNSQKTLFYYDDIHWNERCYRNVITPIILSAISGNNIANGVLNKTRLLYTKLVNSTHFTSASKDPTAQEIAFIKSLPTDTCFDGVLLMEENDNFTYGMVSISTYSYVSVEYRRVLGNQTTFLTAFTNDIDNTATKYTKILQRLPSPTEDYGDESFNSVSGSYYTLEQYSPGMAVSEYIQNGEFIKQFQSIHGDLYQWHKQDGTVNIIMRGGKLPANTDLRENSTIGTGIYICPSGNGYLNAPTNDNFMLLCARTLSGAAIMVVIAQAGIWFSYSSATWIKIA